MALLQPDLLPGHGGGAPVLHALRALLLSHPRTAELGTLFAAACPRC
ncbi:MAG: hypothetical protein ACLRIS_01200 [Flavonifractor plautii]